MDKIIVVTKVENGNAEVELNGTIEDILSGISQLVYAVADKIEVDTDTLLEAIGEAIKYARG